MTVQYSLAMPEPASHLFLVEMTFETGGAAQVDVAMPAWAPGSYMVRDFARNVQDFEALAGRKSLAWSRVDKSTWRIETGGAKRVIVRYALYANELTVRSNHLDVTHGYANGVSTFLYVVGRKEEDVSLVVKPFRGWHVDVALPKAKGSGARFVATDYDHLADSPMEIGTHRTLSFKVRGKPHRVAIYGEGNEDAERIVKDLSTIVAEEAAIFGGLPYSEYVFILHLTDKPGGGLEHRGSNTSSVDRFTFQPDKKYEDFLALEAHEFFHTWNVKRIRPAVLGPFDYSQETHTTLLWAMEGITSYYDHLVLVRAGLMSESRYREFLAETITKLRQQPGRFKLSLAESSFLSWIKLYKQDENWVNTGVSYYLKGELIGLALDLAIRDRTDGKLGLDDVMRALYERYPPESDGIPEPDGWRDVLEETTGLSWKSFFTRFIDGTVEVDFERYLKSIGWTLQAVKKDDKPDEKRKKGDYVNAGGWLGLDVRESKDPLIVKHVLVDSPALRAGLSPGDELLAVDGHKAQDKEWLEKRLRERAPGDSVALHVFRRGVLVEARATLAENPPEKWVITETKRSAPRARRLRSAWLKPLASHRPRRAPPARGNGKGARERIQRRGE